MSTSKEETNILADNLSRQRTLGLYEANDAEKLESEYGKSTFDAESEIICDVNISQNSYKELYIYEKYLDDFPSQSTDTNSRDLNPSSLKWNIDMTKVKLLEQQDTHIAEIATKCKSKKWDITLYFLNEHATVYQNTKDGSNIVHVIMVPWLSI